MGKRNATAEQRTVEELPRSACPPKCSYCAPRPTPTWCMETARFRVIVRTRESETRKSYVITRHVCQKHLPKDGGPSPVALPLTGKISAHEAADIIGVPVMTLHQWRHRGKGPSATKTGRRVWYDRAETERFAEAFRIVNGEG